MELVKNSFLHSTLQQLRLHKLPGMQRDSSSFSFSHDNLGFYFCFRLLVVKVVLVHGNAWKAFAPKRTIITPQAGLNECLQKPKHIIHGNLQNKPEKKVGICQIQSLENMFGKRGGGLWWGHHNDLYGTMHWSYWGCLQLSPKSFPRLEDVPVALTITFNNFQMPFPYTWIPSGSLTVTETHFQGKAVKQCWRPKKPLRNTKAGREGTCSIT